ncbi:MAG: DUF3795 domain-containing protein [Promethearchaeota archaeon]|jgi:hypothetical protein
METEKWDIGICGLNCAKCPDYHTTRCENECAKGLLGVHSSSDCRLLPCAREKGYRYCFECDEFPCQKLEEFATDGWDHHKQTVENMKKMKELGIDRWISEQEKCVFCPGWRF